MGNRYYVYRNLLKDFEKSLLPNLTLVLIEVFILWMYTRKILTTILEFVLKLKIFEVKFSFLAVLFRLFGKGDFIDWLEFIWKNRTFHDDKFHNICTGEILILWRLFAITRIRLSLNSIQVMFLTRIWHSIIKFLTYTSPSTDLGKWKDWSSPST